MAISHIKSNIVPDMTGTVTVFNSSGGTRTIAATDLVRPSDWNSAHQHFMTLSGNTLGASSVSGTNVVFQGGSNVTLSAVQGANIATVLFSAGGGGGPSDGWNIIAAGTQTNASTGTVLFANSNGVSFGLDNGTVTATVKTDYLTSQSNQAVSAANGSYAFQTLSFSNANGVSFGTSGGSAVTASHNALTTARASTDAVGLNTAQSNVTWTVNSGGLSFDARGYAGTGTTFAGTNVSASATLNSAGLNLALSGAGGGIINQTGPNIAAGTQTATSGTVVFSNSNGISFGMSNSSVVTASYTVPSTAGLISAVNVSAGTTSNNLSALTFSNANGITFGLNASTVTASHNGLTSQSNQAVSGSNGSFTFQTITFGNLNGLSLYTSNGSMVGSHNGLTTARASNDGVGLNTAQSNVTWTVNSAGLSLDARGYAGTGTSATNASITLNSNGLAISVAAPGGGGGVALSAGTQSVSTGTVSFANSNGISFGMSNSNQITASYTVPSTAGLISAINVSGGTTSNNLSALTFANANGITFGLNASTMTASHNGLTTARASNDAIGLNTALTAGPLALTINSSGLSLNASSAAGTTSGFGGNLISGSMTHNTAGLNLSLNHPAWLTTAAQSSASNVSAIYAATNNAGGGTATLSGGVSFTNANNATFYTSAGNAIALSLPAYITTARASNDAIGLNTAATNVTWTVNSSGLSLNASGYAGTGTSATNASITLNSNGLAISVNPGGGATPVASASNGSFSFTTLGFSNANNVTFGTSAGSIITASVAAPGAAAENNWINLLGANTAGNTTASGSTIGFSGVNLTLSGTNGSQVVVSAPAVSSLVAERGLTLSSNGSTISVRQAPSSYFAYPQAMINSQSQTVGASTSVVWPLYIHNLQEVDFIRMPQTVSISSMASIATAANTTYSYNQQGTYNFVLYTRGIGASSQSLQSVQSTQYTSRQSINVQAGANGSQWSVTHGYTFQASSTTSGTFSTSYATTLTNVNISTTHLTRLTGMKLAGYQWAMTLNPSMYWMAHGFSTAQTTNGNASLSNMRVTISSWGMSQPNNAWGEFGAANSASVQALYGLGSFSTAGGGTTSSLGFSNISSSASHVIPYLTIGRIA